MDAGEYDSSQELKGEVKIKNREKGWIPDQTGNDNRGRKNSMPRMDIILDPAANQRLHVPELHTVTDRKLRLA